MSSGIPADVHHDASLTVRHTLTASLPARHDATFHLHHAAAPVLCRLVGLVETMEEWEVLHPHWRLHNPERDLGIYLITMREGDVLSLEREYGAFASASASASASAFDRVSVMSCTRDRWKHIMPKSSRGTTLGDNAFRLHSSSWWNLR